MATTVPGFVLRNGPPFARSSCTSRSKPTQTRIASHSAASASGLAAHWAPSFFTAPALAASRSQARVAKPLRARCPMIGVPMRPAPTTPTIFKSCATAVFVILHSYGKPGTDHVFRSAEGENRENVVCPRFSALLRDGVKKCRRPRLDLRDRALERRGDLVRIF